MTTLPLPAEDADVRVVREALTYAERRLRPEFFSDRRLDAPAALDRLAKRVQEAERERDEARRALEFYAERRNYRPAGGDTPRDVPLGGWLEIQDSYDGNGAGARARAALATDPGATE